ncbi:MAG: hypothetical protein ACRCZK_00380 [Oscillospiraceae bacterium]
MAEFMSYDSWRNVTTRNGIKGDEIISALQKSIRRGYEEKAVCFAYEMYISSEQFEDKLWRRLLAISVEDIGFGDLNAPVLVNTLNEIRKNFPYNDGDRPLFFVHAIRYLCTREKERSSDCLKNIVMKQGERGFVPEIPDFAYDCHTAKGREKGRDVLHFLNEASKVMPESKNCEDSYKQRLIEMIKEELNEDIKKDENAFIYNTWQQ